MRGISLTLHDEIEFYPSISKWYKISPFDNKGDASVDTLQAPETEPIDLTNRYVGCTYPPKRTRRPMDVYWVRDERPANLAPRKEFMIRFKYNENASAYAVTWIETGRDQAAILAIGSDDGAAVNLNGERVYTRLGRSGYVSMGNMVPIHLKQGLNELLVKVNQNGWGWGMCAHILDVSGDRSLKGIRYVLKPGGYTKDNVPKSIIHEKPSARTRAER